MTRTSAWHSRLGGPYHDDTECNTGNNIERENRVAGRGGRPHCEECARIQARRQAPEPRATAKARLRSEAAIGVHRASDDEAGGARPLIAQRSAAGVAFSNPFQRVRRLISCELLGPRAVRRRARAALLQGGSCRRWGTLRWARRPTNVTRATGRARGSGRCCPRAPSALVDEIGTEAGVRGSARWIVARLAMQSAMVRRAHGCVSMGAPRPLRCVGSYSYRYFNR